MRPKLHLNFLLVKRDGLFSLITWMMFAAIVTIIVGTLIGCANQPTPPPPMVIVKHDLMPPPKPVIPPDPLAGIPASVQDAIARNEDAPVQEGVTTYYRYDPNGSWTINCQPLFETQIRLAADEQIETKDDVAIGDPSRWTYRVNRHSIYVRPKAASFNIWATGPQAGPPALVEVADHNVTTNIVIRTNKRSYTIIAHLRKPLTQAIAWYYTDDVRTAEAERNQVIKQVELQEHNNGATPTAN